MSRVEPSLVDEIRRSSSSRRRISPGIRSISVDNVREDRRIRVVEFPLRSAARSDSEKTKRSLFPEDERTSTNLKEEKSFLPFIQIDRQRKIIDLLKFSFNRQMKFFEFFSAFLRFVRSLMNLFELVFDDLRSMDEIRFSRRKIPHGITATRTRVTKRRRGRRRDEPNVAKILHRIEKILR